MVLLHPAVEVTVIDESQFSSNDFRDAVPLIVLATVEDKVASSGTGTAPLTSKANANTPFLMASSRELIQNFGVPVFFEVNGTPQHGFELNEYGLLTANKMLNVGNRCWVIRADIDMNQLVSNSTAPTAPAQDNTHWFDIDDTEFGIFQFVAGAWILITPRIINDVTELSGAAPAASIGKDDDFAVVTVSNATTRGENRVYQRLTGQWRNVGSSAWDLESDTTLTGTTPYLSATDNTIAANVGAGDTLDIDINDAGVSAGTAQTVTVTSTISATDPVLALGLTTVTLQGTNLTMFSTTIGDKLTGTTNLANAITTGIPGLEVGDQMRIHAWDTTPGASVNDTATMEIQIVGELATPGALADPVVNLAGTTLIFNDGLGGSITVTFTDTAGPGNTSHAAILTDINNAVSTALGIVASFTATDRLVLTKATVGNNNTNAINITGGDARVLLGYLIGTDTIVVAPLDSGLDIVAFPATMSVEQARRSFYDDFSNLETDAGTSEMAVNISVVDGGASAYVVGDVITLSTGAGTTTKCQVTSVGSGIITGIKLEIDQTDTDIAFVAPDQITSAGSNFLAGIFDVGDIVEVTGSALNDGVYAIATRVDGQLDMVEQTIVAEGVGPSFTITKVDERGGIYTALPDQPAPQGSQSGIGVGTPTFNLTFVNQSNVAVNTVGSVSFDLEFETNADARAMFIENVTGAPISDFGILSTRTSVDLPSVQTILGSPADITAAGNPIALTKNTTTEGGAIIIGAGNALTVLGFTADTYLVNLQEVVNVFNVDDFSGTGATTASIVQDGGFNFIKITNTDSVTIQMSGTAATKLGLSTALVAVSQLFFAEHFNVPVGPSEGDVWIKTTPPNNGADYVIRFLNPASGQFELIPNELFADNAAAFDDFRTSGVGITPVVTTLSVGDLYIQYDVDNDGTASSRIMRYNGSTTLAITSTGTFTPTTDTLTIANGRTGAGSSASLSVVNSMTVSDFAKLINDANVTSIEASVNAGGFVVITNTIGEDIVLTDITSNPSGGTGAWTMVRFDAGTFSNWVPLRTVTLATDLTGYTPSAATPTTTPETGIYWFDGDVSANEIDLLEHNGTTWVTLTNDLQVQATKPTLQSDDLSALVQGDLWIDSSDLELFPNIFRWNGSLSKFEQIDNTDQTTTAGILFADCRPTATTAELDPDSPNPNLFPTGMLLWNGRASSMNVKIQKTNWFGDDFGGLAGDDSFDPDTDYTVDTYTIGDDTLGPLANGKSRWVTASGNKVDGSPYMGRSAQRQIIIEKMAAAMQVDEILDPRARFFNLILAPFYHELMDEMVTLNNTRRETGFIIGDTPARLTPDTTALLEWATNANAAPSNDDTGLVTREENLAIYYPSLGLTTNLDGTEVAMPSSLGALLAYINNDNVAFPWFAPAGLTRGVMSGIFTSMGYLTSEDEFQVVTLNGGQQDTLYTNNINPIIFTPGRGLYINGQKTLHNQTSALDRVNVARLIVFLRFQLELLAEPFLFEINDQLTRDQVKDTFDRFFADLLGLRAIFDFLVVVDETNNTPSRIDRNELWIDIAIQPAKVIEFIFIPIRIKNTGESLTN